jgi:hypothetical protein
MLTELTIQMKYRCTFVDDEGKTCGRLYNRAQHKQDGMCGKCADTLWEFLMEPAKIKPRIILHYPREKIGEQVS